MEVLLIFIGKAIFIIKIIAFPFFFFFISRNIKDYNSWFHEHYTDISSYTVSGAVVLFTPLQIHSQLGLLTYNIVELSLKTIIAVSITFFLNKALKKYSKKIDKTENEDIDKMDEKP